MHHLRRIALPLAFAFTALGAAALAQVTTVQHANPPSVMKPSAAPITAPLPTMTMRPIPAPLPTMTMRPPSHNYVGVVRSGSKVPLTRLPHLPARTMFNTIVPGPHKHGGRFRPMAATGASLTITSAAACTTGGTQGALFNVGCQLTIQAASIGNWSASDSYQYYVVAPNATTATEYGGAGGGCSPTNDPWTSAQSPACTGTSTLLSQQGTYAFFAYDTTAKVIAAIVFVNAGQVFNIQVFQDSFHTEQTYQFDTVSSPAAYIYLTNVTPSDHYVTYVMSTGVNAYCVYMTPAATPGPPSPSPRPTGSGVGNPSPLTCNPANSSGVQAPGGALSVTWVFNSQLEAGSYEIAVFDKDANAGVGELLGTVQVSLTVSGGAALLTQGSTTGYNSASPGPSGPSSTTQVAWNATTDASAGGITGSTQQIIPAGNYIWTISDPQGQIVGTPAPVTLGANGTTSNTFNFTASVQAPGYYPSLNWVMQLYNTGTKQVIGSQAFQMLGYHATTRFIIGGSPSVQLNFDQSGPPEAVTADLQITNDSSTYYPSSGDSFGQGNTTPAIVFTTGRYDSLNASYRPPGTAPNGVAFGGVTVALSSGAAGENCHSASGCSETITDSAGNSWTVNDYCSVQPASSLGLHDQCVVTLTPVNASTVLAPGASIDIPAMIWYGTNTNSSWPCYSTPCFATTSVLPTHGLSWSYTNNLSNPTAWTPVSFGGYNSGLTLKGTARIDLAGSQTSGGTGRNIQTTQGTTPFVGGHFYNANFTRGDYQNATPFAPGTSRYDILSVKITNNSTGNPNTALPITGGGASYPQVAIGFPSYFTTSQITVDSQSTANWTKSTCPATFGSQYICLNGPSIAGNGGTAQVFLDIPLPISSFQVQELSVQAYSADQVYLSLTNDGSSESTIDNQSSFDSLGISAWSLNSALMSASFNPPTVGASQTPTAFQVVVQNATTASDPNPDPIDAIVLEEQGGSPVANYVISGTPTVTTTQGGWSYLTTVAATTPANTKDYWFSVCPMTGNWGTLNGGPPQPRGVSVPLSFASGSSYTTLTPCAAANEGKSLLADTTHSTATINFNLVGPFSAGTQTFYMYAHGANGGGWSAPKTFNVTFSNESASAGFTKIGPTCASLVSVATNAQPTVGTSPNCFVYEVKNTSATSTIGKVFVTLPAYDINGLAAEDTNSNYWQLVTPIASTITLSGNGSTGCTVNTNGANTFNPVPGVSNGQIEIDGCSIPVGKVLDIQFQSYSPNVQNDTYNFPSNLETSNGQATGQTWIGDQSVQVQFTIGLTVTVDPSNPGTGGSTPVVSCAPCAFSGSTIDYGAIANNASVTGTDVAKASVIYEGSTNAATWSLSVGTSSNPTCTGASCGGIANELRVKTDSANSHSKCGNASIVYSNNTSFVNLTNSVALATGPETQCSTPYEIIESYMVQLGTESPNGHIQTITYTLIAN